MGQRSGQYLQRAGALDSRLKPRICIVAQNAYGPLKGLRTGHIGGVEIQTAAFAKWLVQQGYEVSFVTWREGEDGDECIDGVRVLKMCAARAGFAGLRFLHPRLSSFIAALARANADVYYHNCAEYYTGIIAAWCAARRRVFVYSTASDADCRMDRPSWQSRHGWTLYRYGLRRTTRVLVQTRTQLRLLELEYGLKGVHVPMPAALASPTSGTAIAKSGRSPIVLWVGRLDRRKRPTYLFDIAQEMPTTTFRIVAPTNERDPYERDVRARAETIANIQWLGRVERHRMGDVYEDADCLCCTSQYEGFPNTFLEAWSYGIPIVSSFDPDQLIVERRLGVHADTVREFVDGITRMTLRLDERQTASENALRYYTENHSAHVALPRLEAALLEAWSSPFRHAD